IVRHGNVEGLLAAETPPSTPRTLFIGSTPPPKPKAKPKGEASELRPLLAEMHTAALNRSKIDGNPALDVLARLAVLKFLRTELGLQFNQILERCRMIVKSYEGLRPQKALECRERVTAFQVAKKIILRKAGQELMRALQEIDRETLAPIRESWFGNRS